MIFAVKTYEEALLLCNDTLARTLKRRKLDVSPANVPALFSEPTVGLIDLHGRLGFVVPHLLNAGLSAGDLQSRAALAMAATAVRVDQEPFSRPSERQVDAILRRLLDGTSVRRFFDEHATSDPEAAAARICACVLLGKGIADAERAVRTNYNQLDKAELLEALHTVILSSLRDASLETFRENRDVVESWEWSAARDDATCLVCVAMNGTFHSLDEEFITHPGCRCSPSPRTKPMAGFDDDRADPEDPDRTFRREPREHQVSLIPTTAFERWSGGKLHLQDLITTYEHPVWGGCRRVKTDDELSATPDRARSIKVKRPDSPTPAERPAEPAYPGSDQGRPQRVFGRLFGRSK